MITIINVFLYILAIYFIIGILFGIYFFIDGAKRIDSGIKESKWIVRLILIPGVIATWPFLLNKLFKVLKS